MNKHLHRIIFNAARGMRMVVQETASSTGKGTGESRATRGTGSAGSTARTAATFGLFGVLAASTGQAQIAAGPAVPGPLRPNVLVAPNGVPLVNIQTPSAAGVSRNVYDQFDVMRNGAILNNSRSNVQTQLGGFVQGNPWLARGPARVILNEINSGRPTQLRGFVEVGGQRAEVVIANPAGISVDGGGFVNASRATLTTGVPQFNAAGGLDSFVVRGGTVGIDGAGLDATQTDHAAILARAVQVNAGIWANELKVIAGANQVSADHGSVTPVAGTGPAPAFALDVAALGGMYARKITLIGTESGLGVRNAGVVGSAAGSLVVTAQGRLENSGTLEGTRIELTSGTDIDNRGGIIRQTSMVGLTLDSAVLTNTNGGVIGAPPSTPSAGEDSTSSATAALASSGTSTSSIPGAAMVDGGASTASVQVPEASGIVIAAGTIRNDGGRIQAGGAITLKTPQIDNAGGTLHVAAMAVSGANFSNASGTLDVDRSFAAKVGRFDNTGGKLNAGSLDIATSGDLLNAGGTLASGGDADLVVGGHADNTHGTVSATGRLSVHVAQAVHNKAGTLIANQGLSLSADALDNTEGSIQSVDGRVQLAVAGRLNNARGSIGAGADLLLHAGALNTSGTLRAGNDMTLTVADALVNEGSITAGRHAAVAVGNLTSGRTGVIGAGVQRDGTLGSAGDLRVTSTGALVAHGTQFAAGHVTLQGSSIELADGQTRAAGIALTATQGNVSIGEKASVATPGTLRITANAQAGQALANDGGVIHAGRLELRVSNVVNARLGEIVQTGTEATRIDVAGTLNNDGGRIASNGQDLALSAAVLGNADGKVEHAGTGSLRIGGGSYSGKRGQITGNGALLVDIDKGFVQDEGQTHARQITIGAGSLSNRGGTISGASLALDTRQGALDNSSKGTMSATQTLTLRSGALDNDAGLIQSGGAMRIDTNRGVLTNTHAADYRSQPTDLAGGIVSGGTLALKTGELKNTAGSIGSKGALTADTLAFTNTGGGLVLGQSEVQVTTNGAAYNNSGGQTLATGKLVLDTGSSKIANDGGLIRSNAATVLTAGSVVNTNTAGGQQGIEGRNVTIVSAGDVNNTSGRMLALDTLAIRDPNAADPAARTLSITNTGGVLMGGQPPAPDADGTMRPSVGGVRLEAKSFSGDGRIVSAGGLEIALVRDVVHEADLVVDGDLNYTTAGKFTNNAKLVAGQTLTVGAGSLENTATAEMSGRKTVVNAGATLVNRGLIDSQGATQVDAGTLENVGTGRIYGNAVSIAAGMLDNRAETVDGTTRAGTIAARETLNIGAGRVGNREHALIFSGGMGPKAMNIGGKLDQKREATESGDVLDNLSARIESLGGMTISMGQINNLDVHVKLGPPTTTKAFSRTIGVEGIGHFKPEDVGFAVGHPNLKLRFPGGAWRDANGHVWGLWDKTVATTTDTVIDADPAAIVAGGDMTLHGGGLNRDSSITARRTLTAPDIRNEALQGEVTVQTGSIVTWRATRREADVIEPVTRTSKDVGAYVKTGNVDAIRGYDAGKAPTGASSAGGAITIVEVPANVGEVVKVGGRMAGAAVSDVNSAAVAATRTIPMVVRTSAPHTGIPQASLFNLRGGPSGYLVETDPRFASYRQWLSSDYLLNGLGLDPNATLKRLGDGFYEQRLVREQVAQLTGYSYLGGYYNDEEQYTALMNNGGTFARQYGLRPGIALTAAQMAQLTSDIVWLVERTVTLPDGSTQNVLAPQLYVRVRPGDIDGSGALLSAESTVIKGGGDLVNTGTIAGRTLVKIDKDNVNNLGGRIAGANVDIHARRDIDNIGGRITAEDSAVLKADRDVNIETTTRTQGGVLASRTNIDRVAGVYVSNPEGVLAVSAGRDINLAGAVLANAGVASTTLLAAKRNIGISTVKEQERWEQSPSARSSYSRSSSREVGSQVVGGGDVTLDAGIDIRIRGSVANAQGDLTVKAREGSVGIEAGRETLAIDSSSQDRRKGFLSNTTKTQRDSLREGTAIGSGLGGRNVAVTGKDVVVSGGEIIADKDVAIVARRNLTIEAAQNTHAESTYRGSGKSGLMGSGGFGFTIGSRSQSTDAQADNTSAARSTVGSIGGNATLIAGNRYTQIGSDVVAPEGDVTIAAKSIAIREARETSRMETENRQKTGGLTIALTAPAISAVQSMASTAKAMKQAGSGRMKALGAASVAAGAKDVADAMSGANMVDPVQAMGINLSISLGGSQNRSNSTETSRTAAGSRLQGRNVNVLALGGGKDSNILVQGSDIVARDTATLLADNRIDFLAAENTGERHSTNKGSGGSVGVSFGTNGLLFNIGANGSKGKTDGTDTSYTNSHVRAGNQVNAVSGGDMTIKGAVIEADRVDAKVGGDLTVESLQDTSTSTSKQQSVGGSLSVGFGVWSVGVSASSAKADGNYASVSEQSGIKAGDGGFDVDVKGAAGLKGAVIQSTQVAVDGVKNTFKSASLSTSDIQNIDTHKASGASLGMSVSGQQPKGEDKQPIAGSDFNVGAGGGAGAGSASGKQASVTKSGISGIAGDQSVRTGVDSANALVKKWDTDKLLGDVQAQTQITQTFGPKAAKAVGDYAGTQIDKYERAQLQAQQANKVLNDPGASDGQRAQATAALANANSTLAAEQQNYDNWKEGGASRVLAHTLVGGLAGNVQGAAGAALASAAAPVLEGLTKNLSDGVKGAVSAGLAAGLGAGIGGMGGAAAGINAEFNNRQLHPTEGVLIRGNAQAYATQRGISIEQATTELTEQSLRQVDSAWANRISDNPQAAAFLREIARNAVPSDVGGGRLFDAGGTSSYTDHTANASALGQTSDLYNRITNRNASGIVPGVRGAYVAYADAGNDPRLAQKTPEQIQQLLNTGRQLRQEGQSVREGFAVNAANLGISQTVFTSGLARPGDGSSLTDRAVGETGEAALSGLPSEGGAVTTPTRGMRPSTGKADTTGPELPTTTGPRVSRAMPAEPVVPQPQMRVNSQGVIEVIPTPTPPSRQAELNTPDVGGNGRLRPAEAAAAAAVEPLLGTLKRYEGSPTFGKKSPDLQITSGENAGKTVDLMYTTGAGTPSEIAGMNKYFEKSMTVPKNAGELPPGIKQIQDHFDKTDLVVMDFRTLTPQNQLVLTNYINTLPPAQKSRLRIIK